MGQYDQTSDVSARSDRVRGETGRTETDLFPEIVQANLSLAEKLLLWRRREGLTQREAGKRLEISRNTYGILEREESHKSDLIAAPLGDIRPYEKCFIMRRRSGMTIPMCAEQAGISRYWYNLMELGKASPERLVAYWANNEG